MVEAESQVSFCKEDGCYHIEHGDKFLKLLIIVPDRVAGTEILSIEEKLKIPGSTTAVYRAALEIIRRIATETNCPINYEFYTHYQSLQAWALDEKKGSRIFEWDRTQFDGISFTATATIAPQLASDQFAKVA